MRTDKFKPGQIIKIKSGSPRMTIIERCSWSSDEEYKVQWFDKTGVHDTTVHATAIELVR